MIIESVTLQNFKRHKQLTVNFTPGSNLIVGSNYSGKTTILEAITLALWGNSALTAQVSDLISTGATSFTVSLKLSNGITIARTPKSSTVTDPEGVVVVRTHSAVNAYVADLLGVDKKTFLKVFCSLQGSPQALLSMQGMELQRFIEACLGVDDMDAAAKAAGASLRDRNAMAGRTQQQMQEPKFLYDQKVLLEDLIANKAKVEAIVVGAQDEVDKATVMHDEVASYISEQEAINLEVKDYCLKLEMYEERLKGLGVITELAPSDELKDQVTAQETVISQCSQISADIKANEKQINSLHKKQEIYVKVKQEFQKNYPVPVTEVLEKHNRDEALALLSAHNKAAQLLRQAIDSNACGECGRAYEGVADINKLKQDLTQHDSLKGTLQEAANDAETAYGAARKSARKYGEAEREFKDAVAYEKQVQELLQPLTETTLAQLPEGYSYDAALAEVNALKSKLRKLREDNAKIASENRQIQATTDAMAALVKPAGEHKDVQEDKAVLVGFSQTLGDLNTRISRCEVSLATNAGDTGRIQDLLAREEELNTLLAGDMQAVADYTAICQAITSVRGKVVSEGFAQIMAIASEFASSCTGGDISEVFLTDTGIRYMEEGVVRGTVCASGAQKSLMGLGMKLGVSQVVSSPFACLLLDEISADMDEEISLASLTVLGSYTTQAITVSHSMSDVSDNFIEL